MGVKSGLVHYMMHEVSGRSSRSSSSSDILSKGHAACAPRGANKDVKCKYDSSARNVWNGKAKLR